MEYVRKNRSKNKRNKEETKSKNGWSSSFFRFWISNIAYDEQYKANEATQIDGEEAMMALAVRKTFSEKVYDTFVRPFANLFKRKSKAK